MNRRRLGLTLGALLLSVIASGCGASALERHTLAASSLHAIAGAGAAAIEAGARADAEAAVAAGEDPQAAIDRWEPAEAVQRLYAAAVDVYVAAVLVAAEDDDPDWSDALRFLGHALDVYGRVAELLGEYGVELPNPRPVVMVLLGAGGGAS